MTGRSRFAFKATAVALASAMALPVQAADPHVLPVAEVRAQVAKAGQNRTENQAAVDRFLAMPRVQTTLGMAGVNPDMVRQSASRMSDSELAQLAARASAAQAEIVGGALTESQQSLVILAIAGFAIIALLVIAFN